MVRSVLGPTRDAISTVGDPAKLGRKHGVRGARSMGAGPRRNQSVFSFLIYSSRGGYYGLRRESAGCRTRSRFCPIANLRDACPPAEAF